MTVVVCPLLLWAVVVWVVLVVCVTGGEGFVVGVGGVGVGG
ncbi:hypothetical protein [Arthrobacter psychrolactophilus]|nr:hypothetical protein [Arthrobacter psychrolactophilus]